MAFPFLPKWILYFLQAYRNLKRFGGVFRKTACKHHAMSKIVWINVGIASEGLTILWYQPVSTRCCCIICAHKKQQFCYVWRVRMSIIPRKLDTQHSEVFNDTKTKTNFIKNMQLPQRTTAAPIKSSFCNPHCGDYGSSKSLVRQLMLCLCCLCVFEIARMACYNWSVSWYYCSEPNRPCFQDLGILIDLS